MACYSRDFLSKPLRELCGLLLNIKEGKFTPDGTRSGWLSGPQLDLRASTSRVVLPSVVGLEVSSPSLVASDEVTGQDFDPNFSLRWRTVEEPTKMNGTALPTRALWMGKHSLGVLRRMSQQGAVDLGLPKAGEGNLMQNKRSKMLHKRCPGPNNRLQPVSLCGLYGNGFTSS